MILRFGQCAMDIAAHRFARAGAAVHLEPQVFDLIALLAARDGALVTKDELVEQVWRGLSVSDSTISARISAARQAVGDDGTRQDVIETVARRGFRLKLPVERGGAVAPDPESGATPAASRQQIRFAKSADGAGLAYATLGQGPPLLRAGHWLSHLELDWQSEVWRAWLERLGAGRRLIRYDQRGTGLSAPGAGLGRLEDFAGDIKAVADAAGAERFALFAPSGAVPPALAFAATHPERVSALVLYGGTAQGRALRPSPPGELEHAAALSLIRSGWGRQDSPFAAAFSSFFMPDASREQLAEFVAIQLASASAETAMRLREAVDRFDAAPFLSQIRVPVLVLHCRQDAVLDFDDGRRLAAAIPGARFVALEDRNHILLPKSPAFVRMMDEIDGFLAEQSGA